MSRRTLAIIGFVVVVLGIVANSALFTVHQTQQALVLQFGAIKREIQDPGLKVKLPFVQNVLFYEKRVLNVDPPVERVILADQKPLLVDTYARYRIVNSADFYKTVRAESGVKERLGTVINAALRGVLGNETLSSVISEERADIMTQIRDQVNGESKRQGFGIEVIDVRIRRADLPDETSQAVYARMRTEREREAAEFRAQGYEIAQQIRASADREATVIRAEANKEAEIQRGAGEEEANRIYAEAYGQDPEFFRFYRAMQAYRKALGGASTSLVLSPDSDFFRFFGNIGGGGPSGEQ
ncbi:MAG: protease modulator HflC [Alphaproteobacteria bacterium]